MGAVIHDDYWEAAQAMPEDQRAGFIYAIAAYSMTGEEPEGNPPWLPAFIVVRRRIEMGAEASERGRRRAEARWGSRGERSSSAPAGGHAPEEPADVGEDAGDAGHAQASGSPDARAHATKAAPSDAHAHARASSKRDAQAHARASSGRDAEVEVEDEVESTPHNPPRQRDGPPYERIVDMLNQRAGTSFRASSKRTRRLIDARWAEGWRMADFWDVVSSRCDEWLGDDRMRSYLRPETLFGPKFEGYVQAARAGGGDGYGEYR